MPARGFTILEVLAAISIMALIAILGIPAFRARQQSVDLYTSAQNLQSNLRQAQQKTVGEQTTYLVKLITNAPQGWELIRRSGGDTTIENHTLTAGITWQNTGGFTSNEIIFTTNGAVVESGTITLQNAASKTAAVEVKPSGYVRVN